MGATKKPLQRSLDEVWDHARGLGECWVSQRVATRGPGVPQPPPMEVEISLDPEEQVKGGVLAG